MRGLVERSAMVKKLKKAKEPLLEMVGALSDSEFYFLPSFSEVVLKTLYEILMPIAQRTGKNEILLPAVENKELEQILLAAGRLGLSVKRVAVDRVGKVTKEALEGAISKRTLAFFSSWVNEVNGAVYPIGELCSLCKERDVFTFVEASAVAGKIYFRLQNLGIDVCCITFEKGAVVFAGSPLKGSPWGEDFSLEAFFAASLEAEELLSAMDRNAMEQMSRKALVEEKYGDRVTFINSGADYLFDRWCFAIPNVLSENLAYHLLAKGIAVEYLDVAKALQSQGMAKEVAICSVTMPISLKESREEMVESWEKIMQAAAKIMEYGYV